MTPLLCLLLAAQPGLDTSGGFRHETHLALEASLVPGAPPALLTCSDCHLTTAEKGWLTDRPGKNDHAPCDSCHAAEYYRPPGEYCRVCHISVDPLSKGNSPLGEFPRRGPQAQLVSLFDHRLHLDPDNRATDLACASCHRLEKEGSAYLGIPRHPDCAGCHAEKASPKMSDCTGCHTRDAHKWARSFASNDIHFTHAKHLATPDGEPVDCERCHDDVRDSGATTRLRLPKMKDCAICHDDASVTPDSARMWRCTQCHFDPELAAPADHTTSREVPRGGALASAPTRPSFFSALAPLLTLPFEASLAQLTQDTAAPAAPPATGLLPRPAPVVREDVQNERRPEDHTPIFRTRHERQASDPDAKCSYCHGGVSGSTRDACNDCHLTTRPRSHDLRFAGPRHGRLAAARPEACSTCHEVDYCQDCHDIAPTNHFPLTSFLRLHAPRARANTRACLTCHSFESTCERCHRIDGIPGGARP